MKLDLLASILSIPGIIPMIEEVVVVAAAAMRHIIHKQKCLNFSQDTVAFLVNSTIYSSSNSGERITVKLQK
jgi:hypothetical protein